MIDRIFPLVAFWKCAVFLPNYRILCERPGRNSKRKSPQSVENASLLSLRSKPPPRCFPLDSILRLLQRARRVIGLALNLNLVVALQTASVSFFHSTLILRLWRWARVSCRSRTHLREEKPKRGWRKATEKLKPTIGLEPMTCRLRIDCSTN